MANETTEAALSALSILTGAATDIYKTNTIETQNNLDREEKKRQSQIQRDHALNLQNRQHENNLETNRENFNRQLMVDYPGLTPDTNGNVTIPLDYDYTQTKAFKETNTIALTERLISSGNYDSTDSFDMMSKKDKAFMIGDTFTSNMFGENLGNVISVARGGDVSKGMLTTQDIQDFEAWYKGNLDSKGVLTPMGISQLQDMKLLSNDINIQYDPNTDLPYIDEKDMVIIDATISGIKKGVVKNAEYKTQSEYDQILSVKRQESVAWASQFAGSAYANQVTAELTEDKASLGAYVGWTTDVNDPTKLYMNWGGNKVNYSDVIETIKENKSLVPEVKSNMVKLVTNLQGLNIQGVGASSIAEFVEGLGANGKTLLQELQRVEDGSLAEKINQIINKTKAIDDVVNISGNYMESPIEFNKATALKDALGNAGIYTGMQSIRNMEVSLRKKDNLGNIMDVSNLVGDPNYNKEYDIVSNEISGKITRLYQNLIDNGDAEKAQELKRWIELEDVTNTLSLLSITK